MFSHLSLPKVFILIFFSAILSRPIPSSPLSHFYCSLLHEFRGLPFLLLPVYICIYIYVCVYVCMCVYVCVCVWIRMRSCLFVHALLYVYFII